MALAKDIKRETQVQSTKQRNHHLAVDHVFSSHLLTSTS